MTKRKLNEDLRLQPDNTIVLFKLIVNAYKHIHQIININIK